MPTPDWQARPLGELVLIGLLLGIVPIALGLLAYPALRAFGPAAMTLPAGADRRAPPLPLRRHADRGPREGRRDARPPARHDGRLGRRGAHRRSSSSPSAAAAARRRRASRLAFFIALGIGLHNLGEGLAVGAALATGAAALATFLVVGFVIHNVTEGIGIAAPLVGGTRPSLAAFAGLAALAGLPAIVGVVLGTAGGQPLLDGGLLRHRRRRDPPGDHRGRRRFLMRREGGGALAGPASAGGIIAGLAIMYATALLV